MKKFIKKNKKVLFIIACIITVILLIIIVKKITKTAIIPTKIPTLPRPFVNLYDDKGNLVNVILVSHPFTRKQR